jgi:hypothetical protein
MAQHWTCGLLRGCNVRECAGRPISDARIESLLESSRLPDSASAAARAARRAATQRHRRDVISAMYTGDQRPSGILRSRFIGILITLRQPLNFIAPGLAPHGDPDRAVLHDSKNLRFVSGRLYKSYLVRFCVRLPTSAK